MFAVTDLYDLFHTAAPGVVLCFIAYIVYYAIAHGVPATISLIKGWYNRIEVDVVGLESRVTALEVKLGLKAAPPTVAPTAPATPTAPTPTPPAA